MWSWSARGGAVVEVKVGFGASVTKHSYIPSTTMEVRVAQTYSGGLEKPNVELRPPDFKSQGVALTNWPSVTSL